MIEVERLTKNYGLVAAIRDLSFTVSPGPIVGFLGPNGAGKSTTMRILACFMPASSGVARVAGYDVFRQSIDVRRRIGYLPENVPLYTDMRVAPYLEFVAEVKGVGRAERRRRVADVMDRCMVTEVQNRLIGKLSKGFRQRVGLAQAIVSDPEVLILDEPTIGLDVLSKERLRVFLTEQRSLHGTSLLLATHDMGDVRRLTERILVVDHGRLAFDGTLAQLVEQVGAERIVVLDLTDPAAPLDGIPGTRLVEVEADGLRQRLSFGPGETTVAAILAVVAQRLHGQSQLHDLTIEEPDIEAVVRRLYAT
jgi:ABC-2 type transport system ATP-binding protein